MKDVPYILSENSLTIFWEGKPYTLRKDHVNFNLAKDAVMDARYDDLGDLLDIAKAIEDFVQGDIEVKDEVVYYKGHRLHGVVVDKLLEMLRAGMKDSAPLVNFITKLQANPSANSVNELYSFMSYKSLPNTPEGKILGYKGVQEDFWSNTGNADTIVLQGQTNERHQIFNGVGETIEVARRCVDDNKDNHCSFGLHIGSYDYANNWAGEDGRLLVVEFNPEDAVSVPTDCDFQKLRVSKYRVVSDITDTRKELNKPVYEANKPIYGSNEADLEVGFADEDGDYVDEDEDWDNESFENELNEDSDRIKDHYENNPKDLLVNNPQLVEAVEKDLSKAIDDSLFGNSQREINEYIHCYLIEKISNEIYPTLKNVADLRMCKNNKIRCKDVVAIVEDLGYNVEEDDQKPLYQLLIK